MVGTLTYSRDDSVAVAYGKLRLDDVSGLEAHHTPDGACCGARDDSVGDGSCIACWLRPTSRDAMEQIFEDAGELSKFSPDVVQMSQQEQKSMVVGKGEYPSELDIDFLEDRVPEIELWDPLSPDAFTRSRDCHVLETRVTCTPDGTDTCASMHQDKVPFLSYFQVKCLGGVDVRVDPHFDAPLTGLVLPQLEIITISEELTDIDGRTYLRLADGRGWVFDDAALFPHDPSVIRCTYTAQFPALPCNPPPLTSHELPIQQPPWPFQGKALPPAPLAAPPLAPIVELLASTQGSSNAVEHLASSELNATPVAWYRVAHLGGISVRVAPSIEAPCTGMILPQNETFPVSEEFPGADGRTFLRLCDGRGWVFDDTALMPHNPSVKRGEWLEEIPGADGHTYLRLCDGRGWVVDDTSLMPHNPSLKRDEWLEEVPVADGRTYLRLCHGRGWDFDYTALTPHNPSVKGDERLATNLVAPQLVISIDGALQQGKLHSQPQGNRSKRGGKRQHRHVLAQNAESIVEP